MPTQVIPPKELLEATLGGLSLLVVAGGSTGYVLTKQSDGTYAPAAASSGSGDVVGPASATDNAVARFDATTGKIVQNSVVTIGDTGNITGLGTVACGAITASGTVTGPLLASSSAVETQHTLTNTAASSNGAWSFGIGSGSQLGHGQFAIGLGSTIAAATRNITLATGGVVQIGNPTASILAGLASNFEIRPNVNVTTGVGGISYSTNNAGTLAHTTGNANPLIVGIAFAPTSGSGVLNQLNVSGAINQTGGANGITRGIYVNPTLTAAADYRAIEVSAGKSVFQAVEGTTVTASGTITTRNSTTATKTEVYNTYTSPTVYERAVIDWVTTANTCKIGTEKGASGGTARDLCFVTDGTARITVNGTTGVSTCATQVILAASTTSLSSLRIPNGSAPTSPVDGDEWSTSSGRFSRINGVTHKIGGETRQISFVIGDGTNVITTGRKAGVQIPFDCVITGWSIFEDTSTSSSIAVDIWKDTYANFPPTVADTIAASAKPTLSSATSNQDNTLTGWTTAVSAGDFVVPNVDSVTAAKRVVVVLRVRLK